MSSSMTRLKYFKVLLFISFILLLTSSCVERFTPNIEGYENVLVVDALLSDESPAATVRLSYSFPYQESVTKPAHGMLVQILDAASDPWTLTETDDGIYQSAPGQIPESGARYKLRIVDSNGEIYESDYEEFLEAPVIDSVFFRQFYNSVDHPFDGEEGIEIHAAAHAGPEDSRYYEWRWKDTWELIAPVNLNGVRPCWQQQTSPLISISTTENLSENKLPDVNLYFIPSALTSKLSVRYNTRLNVYSLDRDSYQYLQKTLKVNSGSGGFFDPIPGAVNGNIHNIRDENLPVIGLFCASAFHSVVKVITKKQLKIRYFETGFTDCDVQVVPKPANFFASVGDRVGNYYYGGEVGGYIVLVNIQKCYDCSYIGVPTQPDDWH